MFVKVPTIATYNSNITTSEDLVRGVREMNALIAKADATPGLAYVPRKPKPQSKDKKK